MGSGALSRGRPSSNGGMLNASWLLGVLGAARQRWNRVGRVHELMAFFRSWRPVSGRKNEGQHGDVLVVTSDVYR